MANWSDVTIELYGKEKNIELLFQELENIKDGEECLIPSSTKLFTPTKFGYSEIDILEINKEKKSIFILGSGRWSGPNDYIISLVKKFNLSGIYFDLESGCDLSHKLEFNNGKLIKETENVYFSQLTLDYHGIEYFDNYFFDTYFEGLDYDYNYITTNNLTVIEIQEYEKKLLKQKKETK